MARHRSLFAILFAIVVISSVAADKDIEDCELISLEELKEPRSSGLGESLQLSVRPRDDDWNASAVLVDSMGKECTLVLLPHENDEIKHGIECKDGHRNLIEPDDNHRVFLKNIWTDIQLGMEKVKGENGSDLQNKTLLKMVMKGRQVFSAYKPFLKEVSLQPPLEIQWRNKSKVDLVLNCPDKDCLKYSTTLPAGVFDQQKPFYLKAGASLDGLTVTLNYPYDLMSGLTTSKVPNYTSYFVPMNDSLRAKKNIWSSVSFVKEGMSLKLVTAEEELGSIQVEPYEYDLHSLSVNGTGLLTWCQPNHSKTPSTKSGQPLLPWVLVGLLAVVVTLVSVALVCQIQRSSPQVTRENVPSSSSVNCPTTRPPVPQVSVDHEPEHVYEDGECFFSSLTENKNRRGSAHDSENSLYGTL